MKPEEELDFAINNARARIMSHRGWRSGPDRLYKLLQLATHIRQMEPANNIQTDVPWETVLGQLIEWHHEIPIAEGEIGEEDSRDLLLGALAFARLDHIQLTARSGGYHIRKSRGEFVLSHKWDPAIEVADFWLEDAASLTDPFPPSSIEQQWIDAKPASSREYPPLEVLQAAASRAESRIGEWRTAKYGEGALSTEFSLGGDLTIGHASKILAGLMGLADLCEYTAIIRKRSETALAQLSYDDLVDILCELSPACKVNQVEELVDRLTYKPGRPTRSSPLVRHGESIMICPPLIGSRLIDPILLRSAGYDPSGFGQIGRELGMQAKRWADWFSKIPDVLVAERIRLLFSDGRTAGDLDIVAIDPKAKVVVCMEIKSPIDSWSLTEVLKAENMMTEACHQLAARRHQINDGIVKCRYPRHWPDVSSFEWTWAVGLPRQLCLRPPVEPDMQVTSLQFVESLGEPSKLEAVASTLCNPAYPKEGVHYRIERRKIRYEQDVFNIDTLAIDRNVRWCPLLN